MQSGEVRYLGPLSGQTLTNRNDIVTRTDNGRVDDSDTGNRTGNGHGHRNGHENVAGIGDGQGNGAENDHGICTETGKDNEICTCCIGDDETAAYALDEVLYEINLVETARRVG